MSSVGTYALPSKVSYDTVYDHLNYKISQVELLLFIQLALVSTLAFSQKNDAVEPKVKLSLAHPGIRFLRSKRFILLLDSEISMEDIAIQFAHCL
jgi:hypothetical protein